MQLIDRIGLALLVEPMTIDDLCLMLHATRKDVCRELRHLVSSKTVCTRNDRAAELAPLYFLTRRGREWAEGAITKETTT